METMHVRIDFAEKLTPDGLLPMAIHLPGKGVALIHLDRDRARAMVQSMLRPFRAIPEHQLPLFGCDEE